MSEWQPIETALKDGTIVLLSYYDGQVETGYWNGILWADTLILLKPTHWMPIPEPPA